MPPQDPEESPRCTHDFCVDFLRAPVIEERRSDQRLASRHQYAKRDTVSKRGHRAALGKPQGSRIAPFTLTPSSIRRGTIWRHRVQLG